ncbi:nucleoside hydrolase [Minwuia sp.]|uniref:nucleoside hydrolase n=1 Tax=Minwuia sp. TaxID=2493630 RepID=UPI003A92AA4F
MHRCIRLTTVTTIAALCCLCVACGTQERRTGLAELAPLPIHAGTSLWIDTDPVSRPNQTADIDDVLAVRMILASGIRIEGISTTHGNGSAEETWQSAVTEFETMPLHRGQPAAGCVNPAVAGLATVLHATAVTILALGPLTNIAQLLACHPRLGSRIVRIVAVAGRHPGERFRLGGGSTGIELRDLNYETDRAAFRAVLTSGVPVDLVPFAAGNRVRLTYDDLDGMPERLRDRAWSWALILWFAGGGGTLPAFDQTAAGLLLWPGLYGFEPVIAEAGQDLILRPDRGTGRATLRRCLPRDAPQLKQRIRRLQS